MDIIKKIWWLLFVAIPFIFVWVLIAPNFMPIMDTLYGVSQNTTYAIATNATANMTVTENFITSATPTIWFIFPIGFIILIAILYFRSNINPEG